VPAGFSVVPLIFAALIAAFIVWWICEGPVPDTYKGP